MKILHSKIIGKGTPFLILHGYLGMGDNWKSMGNALGAYYKIHMIDQRNHGRSFHSEEFHYELMVEDLLKYVNYYQLDNIVLLGHSMGGKTAMSFAVTYPQLINKLIIADISPRDYQPHHNEILKALNSVDFSIQNSRKLIDQKLSEYIPEIGVRSFLLKNVYWKEKGILDFRFHLQSLTKNNHEIGKPLPTHSIFEGETLFLAGENSEYITGDDIPIIDAHFPNSQIKTIHNAGHWLHAEQPKQFYEMVMNFLSF